ELGVDDFLRRAVDLSLKWTVDPIEEPEVADPGDGGDDVGPSKDELQPVVEFRVHFALLLSKLGGDYMREQEFESRIVIVTGASSGIGRATAERFAREGARVAVFARSLDKLRALADGHGERMLAVAGDVANADDI